MERSIDLAVQHIVVPKCVIEMMMHGLMIVRTTQVLIVHGTEDRLVDVEQSMSLAKVLQMEGMVKIEEDTQGIC